MIRRYMPTVKVIAKQLYKKIGFAMPLDELIQLGSVGLMQAIDSFDPDRGVLFKTFSEFRIRGHIMDHLRTLDPMGRFARDRKKAIEAAIEEFEKSGERPTDEQVAESLELSVEQFRRARAGVQEREIQTIEISDIQQFTREDRQALLTSSAKSYDIEAKIDAMRKIEEICRGHHSINRAMYKLYVIWGFKLHEIAELFGVTESRVSQRVQRVASGIRDEIALAGSA